jgi:hypothetical protein
MAMNLKGVLRIFSLVVVFSVVFSCASNSSAGYKPKYKKPNPNKPLPCPLKDC